MTDSESAADLRAAHWLYRILPQKAIAYAQLMRLDRPIGAYLLFWPCIWGLLLGFYACGLRLSGGSAALPAAHFLPVSAAYYHAFAPLGFFIFAAALFYIGAVLMRGAGCAYNDMADYKIDGQVARTATRPLPSGRVSRAKALGFTAALALSGLPVLLQFNVFTIILTLSSLLIVALYPFVKRFSDWPQAVLGLCFNWGVLVGFAAVAAQLAWPALALYAGAVCWTIGYDTIYAHQDREYDAALGMRSTALLFGRRTRAALVACYALAFAGLFTAFYAVGGGFWPLCGALAAGGCLLWQILRFDMDNPALCLRLFKSNNWAGLVFSAFALIGLCA